VITGVEVRNCVLGSMALGAVGIDIGAGTIFQTWGFFVETGEGWKRSQIVFVQSRIEQAGVIPRSELIVGKSRWEAQIAIQFSGFHAEDETCIGGVTGKAILPARIVPLLSSQPGRRLNRDGFREIGCEQ